MKKTLNLVLLLWLAMLAACSADEPQTISATEEYNREFVKEFGAPAAGHDYSMATTAGLKVTSAAGDHITVTAEIDGVEYLFADCHVPAGTTAVPVTIPRTVSQLKLATTRGTRTVAANALVNLDEIKTTAVHRAADVDPNSNPILFFQMADFLEGYFMKKKDYQYIYSDHLERTFTGYLFPVFWKPDRNGNVDYEVKFVSSWFGRQDEVRVKDINFAVQTNPSTPFPDLMNTGYTTIEDVMTKSSPSTSTPFPYSSSKQGDFIYTRGIRIEDYVDEDRSTKDTPWYIEISHTNGHTTCSESPYRNIALWDGNYYDVPLGYLNNAYYCNHIYGLPDQDFYMVDHRLVQCEYLGYGFKKFNHSAQLIGFSSAPSIPAGADPRDYLDVVFLYIPTGSQSHASASATPHYEWTIAAEDLGATDDWDFNDAVFTFTEQIRDLNTVNVNEKTTTIWGPRDAEPVRVISVAPKAAGGTMPLYITYTGKVAAKPTLPDGAGASAYRMYSAANNELKQFNAALDATAEGTFIVGKEIHAWLGADSYKTMVNTGATNLKLAAEPVEFAIPLNAQLGVGYDASTGKQEHGNLMGSAVNKNLCGFAVVVDKNNTLGVNAMNDTENGMHRADNLVMGQDMYVIGRPDAANGEIAPQMLLMGSDWRWPQERVKISDAYPDFASWLANPSTASNWTYNYVKDKVTY